MLVPSDGHASWCVFGCRLRQERDMAVMTKHLAIDMPGDLHDGFVAGAIFGHFRDESVPVIMPPALHFCVPAGGLPGCLERGNMPRRVRGPGFTPGTAVP